jgi:mannose-1-phosphate guanylyltransferase
MSLAGIDVAVLAGGLGTRIRSILGDTPKVLAPVEGRPYLAWLLDWLAGFGNRRVVLCLGHLSDRVTAWVDENTPPGMEIAVSIEPEPMGTAGAIRLAQPLFRSDPVLVMNGDTFVGADLAQFLRGHHALGTDMSLLCVEVDDAGRYGRVEIDKAGRIERFSEKEPGPARAGVINAGIYALSRAAQDKLAVGTARSIERDIFMATPAESLGAVVTKGQFIDIGTPESLRAAGKAFRAIAASRAEPTA